MFKLAERRGGRDGLYCGWDGVYLGPAALIERREGRYWLRAEDEVAALLAAAYETPPDVARFLAGLYRFRCSPDMVEWLGKRTMFGGMTMPAYFFRSEPGAAELRRLARGESGRVCQRVLMIANLLEGMEHEEAARLAGLSRSSAYEWHNRYEEDGIEGLRDRPRPVAGHGSTPRRRRV